MVCVKHMMSDDEKQYHQNLKRLPLTGSFANKKKYSAAVDWLVNEVLDLRQKIKQYADADKQAAEVAEQQAKEERN